MLRTCRWAAYKLLPWERVVLHGGYDRKRQVGAPQRWVQVLEEQLEVGAVHRNAEMFVTRQVRR